MAQHPENWGNSESIQVSYNLKTALSRILKWTQTEAGYLTSLLMTRILERMWTNWNCFFVCLNYTISDTFFALHFILQPLRSIEWHEHNPQRTEWEFAEIKGVSVQTAAFLWNRENGEQLVWGRLLAPSVRAAPVTLHTPPKWRRKNNTDQALPRSCAKPCSTAIMQHWLNNPEDGVALKHNQPPL